MNHDRIDPAAGPSERSAALAHVRVGERMSRPAVTVLASAPIAEAVRLMAMRRIHHLPVVERDGRLVGIVNADDVLAIRRPSGSPQRLVAAVMTAPVVSLGPTVPLGDAMRLMADHGVGALPVVEDGRVVGIITQSDIVVAVARRASA
jgi:acetoin utilization protein AcuB